MRAFDFWKLWWGRNPISWGLEDLLLLATGCAYPPSFTSLDAVFIHSYSAGCAHRPPRTCMFSAALSLRNEVPCDELAASPGCTLPIAHCQLGSSPSGLIRFTEKTNNDVSVKLSLNIANPAMTYPLIVTFNHNLNISLTFTKVLLLSKPSRVWWRLWCHSPALCSPAITLTTSLWLKCVK